MQDIQSQRISDDPVLSVRSEYPHISILYPPSNMRIIWWPFFLSCCMATFHKHGYFLPSQLTRPFAIPNHHRQLMHSWNPWKRTSLLKHVPGNQGLAEHDETIWTTCHHLNVSCLFAEQNFASKSDQRIAVSTYICIYIYIYKINMSNIWKFTHGSSKMLAPASYIVPFSNILRKMGLLSHP